MGTIPAEEKRETGRSLPLSAREGCMMLVTKSEASMVTGASSVRVAQDSGTVT